MVRDLSGDFADHWSCRDSRGSPAARNSFDVGGSSILGLGPLRHDLRQLGVCNRPVDGLDLSETCLDTSPDGKQGIAVGENSGEGPAELGEECLDDGQGLLEFGETVEKGFEPLLIGPQFGEARLERVNPNPEKSGNLNVAIFTRADFEESLSIGVNP
jgi:hypothetical protein